VFSSTELPENLFEVSVFIDDLEPYVGMATRVSENSAALGLPLNEGVLEAFQAGWFMTIEVAGWKQTYKLRGTRITLDAAKDCYIKYSQYQIPYSLIAPIATENTPAPAPE
jgi:hypothetical protein